MSKSVLDSAFLQPSGAVLAAELALGAAIERCALEGIGHDSTTVDLLVRLDLAPDQRLRAVELCEQLLKSPSHISRMIDRAAAAGLVEREPDPDDRRASQVVLTAAGSAVVEAFGPRLQAVLQHAVYDALEPQEITRLIDYLMRIEAAARSCPVANPA